MTYQRHETIQYLFLFLKCIIITTALRSSCNVYFIQIRHAYFSLDVIIRSTRKHCWTNDWNCILMTLFFVRKLQVSKKIFIIRRYDIGYFFTKIIKVTRVDIILNQRQSKVYISWNSVAQITKHDKM